MPCGQKHIEYDTYVIGRTNKTWIVCYQCQYAAGSAVALMSVNGCCMSTYMYTCIYCVCVYLSVRRYVCRQVMQYTGLYVCIMYKFELLSVLLVVLLIHFTHSANDQIVYFTFCVFNQTYRRYDYDYYTKRLVDSPCGDNMQLHGQVPLGNFVFLRSSLTVNMQCYLPTQDVDIKFIAIMSEKY
jgi:hypothetical protein